MADGIRTPDLPSASLFDEMVAGRDAGAGMETVRVARAAVVAQLGPELQLSTALLPVQTRTLATPPGSPTTGQAWIVAASPTGAWSGKVNNIARWTGSAWQFIVPTNGVMAFVIDEFIAYAWDSGSSTWEAAWSGGWTVRGEWSGATAYVIGDVVARLGSSYLALAASTNLEPEATPASWLLLAAKGDPGNVGATGAVGAFGFDRTYPTTAAALSNGVAGLTGLVGGSGGTNGTFALAFSGGGGADATGYFIVSGGAVVQAVITFPGYNYTSAPTVSFAASSGLTGASATAVLRQNVPVNGYFSTPGTDSVSTTQWVNTAGVAVRVADVPSSAAASGRPNAERVAYMLDAENAGAAAIFANVGGQLLIKDNRAPEDNFLGGPTSKISTVRSTVAQFFDERGVMQTAAINASRYGWTRYPISGPPGLIGEDSRTNYALHSRGLHITHQLAVSGGSGTFIDGETVNASGGGSGVYRAGHSTSANFGISGGTGTLTGTLTGATSGATRTIGTVTTVWAATNVTVAKDAVGLDAIANSACTLAATASNGTVLQAITLASGVRWLAIYVKRLVGSGAISMTMDGGTTWTVVSVGVGWARLEIPTQTLANPSFGFRIATSGDSIAVDLVQLENSSNAASTSIITTTASLTRAADITSLPLSSLPFDAAAGTIYAEFISDAPNGQQRNIWSLDDGTDNNVIYARAATGHVGVVIQGGVTQASVSIGAPIAGTVYRSAVSWQTDSVKVALNGILATPPDTSAVIPTGLTHLRLSGFRWDGGGLRGRLFRLVYVPRVSTDAELRQWTLDGWPSSQIDAVALELDANVDAETAAIRDLPFWRNLLSISDRTRRDDVENHLTYYANSGSLGLDAANGLGKSTPKKTIAGMMALTPGATDTLGLAAGSSWREMIKPTSGVRRVQGVGEGTPPKLDGAAVISSGSFALSAHVDAAGVVYEVTLSRDSNGTWVSGDTYMMWENDEWLVRRTSVALCAANPGSFYSAAPEATSSASLFYVHPFGSTNPTSDGKTYEYSRLAAPLELGSNGECIIEGIHATRGASAYGSLAAGVDTILRRVLVSKGGKHNCVLASGIIEDSISFDCEIGRSVLVDGGYIPWTFYRLDATNLEWLIRRSMSIMPSGRPSVNEAVYAHGGSNSTSHRRGVIDGFISLRGGYMSAIVTQQVIRDFCHLEPWNSSIAISPIASSVEITRYFVKDTRSAVTDHLISHGPTAAAASILMRDCAISSNHSAGSGGFHQLSVRSASVVDCQYNTFWRAAPIGGVAMIENVAAGSQFKRNIICINNAGNLPYVLLNSNVDADYNVYINFTGSNKYWQHSSGTASTLAGWRTATGKDTNSVLLDAAQAADLFLGDPTSGDFRLNPRSQLKFADGSLIVGNSVGAGVRNYYDWNNMAAVAGQPSAFPSPPDTLAECESYISNPFAWDFY